jgi:transcriptional regulator with XRE-family HTH domain
VNIEETFSVRLKSWRKQHRHSQEVAAEILGVSRSYLNQVERRSRSPGHKLVNKLNEVVGAETLQRAREAVAQHDWEKAFHHFVHGAEPISLIEHLKGLLADDSIAIEKRMQIAETILPVIKARVSQLQRDLEEAQVPRVRVHRG